MTSLMDRIDRVLQDALVRITPTEKERKEISDAIEKVKRAVDSVLKKRNLSYTIAGSYNRDTWMKDKREFDVFVLFPVSYSRERLEEEGLSIGKEIMRRLKGRHKVAYAEHPYVRGSVGGFDIDIVPCYKVESAYSIKSSVDRTPFHNEWLSRHLLKELVPDVRLLKQFCKALSLYGSDAKTEGFSGYLCELLIIRYKSFKNLLREASSWEPGRTVIDLEGHVSDYKAIHRKFPGQPLIVIDPVDPGRNVAAALSPRNFVRFVSSCRRFLKNPSLQMFFPSPEGQSLNDIRSAFSKRETFLLGLSFRCPEVIADILWPQLRKTAARLGNVLSDNGFRILNTLAWSNEKDLCAIVFELEYEKLPRIRKIIGPSVFSLSHSRQFIEKYKKPGRVWVEGEFWVAEVKRRFRTPESILKDFLSSDEKRLKEKGVASHMAREIARGFNIMKVSGVFSLAGKEKNFRKALEGMFFERAEI